MNSNFLILTLALIPGAASAAAVTSAELTELQFHKVNQLAATKKIDQGFVDHLVGVSLKKDPASPNFLVTFTQETDAGKTASAVVVSADDSGKPLGFSESRGTAATRPADWGGKAPLDLLEKAMEYVSDTTADPLLPAFRNSFTTASIAPFQQNGLVGKVTVKAGPADGTLTILVDLNGKILSDSKQ